VHIHNPASSASGQRASRDALIGQRSIQATRKPELAQARFVERPLNQKASIAVAKLVGERERLFQKLDDLAPFLRRIAHDGSDSACCALCLVLDA
jgi:hypothetical protein